MQLYGVLGNPIAHSKSPMIHAMFARNCGIDLEYKAFCLAKDNFEGELADLIHQGLLGANVTVPFKENAFRFAHELTIEAKEAGAVNTLRFSDDKFIGHNTDGNGLLCDLVERHHLELADKRILVLGAGGATKGILGPLLRAKPAEVVISNRTHEKAVQLTEDFSQEGNINACEWQQLSGRFDVIINATSSSLSNEFTPLPCEIDANTIGYDLMYGTKPTVFMEYLADNGAEKSFDGLGMLVEQAALSFEFWHGVKPETEMVYQDLRQVLLSYTADC